MKLYKILVCLALLPLASCVSTVGHRSPLYTYVGKDLSTKRRAFLYETEVWKGSDFYFSAPKKRPCLGEYDHAAEWEKSARIADVPVGTPLKIRTVKRFLADYDAVQAEGEIYLSGSARPTMFFYMWAFDGVVKRAPWEDDSIPEERHE